MILVDSCGWLEAIKGAGLAASYAPALAEPDEALAPTVCVLEVARVMCRERGEQAAAGGVIYATAQAHGAEVWTHDEHFRGLPGVRFVEAPAEA